MRTHPLPDAASGLGFNIGVGTNVLHRLVAGGRCLQDLGARSRFFRVDGGAPWPENQSPVARFGG